MLAIAGFSLAALLARTIDSTRACVRLIQQISEYPIHWPEKAPEKPHENAPEVAAERVKDTDPAMSELLGIRLIALRTEAVEKLMYPPCLVVCLLLLAQSQYLDRWGWSIPVLATFGLMLLSAIYCGVLLRYWAERARRAALQDVQEELIRESSKKEAKPELLKAVIEEISSTRRGAFSPIQENPLLHAVLIPFGGVGVIELAKTILLH
jgi:hypothetical protein